MMCVSNVTRQNGGHRESPNLLHVHIPSNDREVGVRMSWQHCAHRSFLRKSSWGVLRVARAFQWYVSPTWPIKTADTRESPNILHVHMPIPVIARFGVRMTARMLLLMAVLKK